MQTALVQRKVIRSFTDSAGVLLLAVGIALFISNGASVGFVLPHDPLFRIPMSIVFWIFGAIELCVGLVCLFGKSSRLKLNLVLWLALIFLAYQLGLFWIMGMSSFNGYCGDLAGTFGISFIVASLILKLFFLYFLIGGSISLLLTWGLTRAQKPSSHQSDNIKTPCPSCGGIIRFSTRNIGQKIPCPHCREPITLQAPGNLKMSCVLCGGNIEFPAHALGQKIPCPHCRATITLLTQLARPNPAAPPPMAVQFSCINPACQQHIMVDLSWCGRQTQCPACGTILQVPTFNFQIPNPPAI